MLIEQRIQGHPALIRDLMPGEEWIEFLIDLLVQSPPVWALETAVRMSEGRSQLVLDLTGLSSLDTVDFPDHYTSDRGQLRLQAIVRSLLDAQDALVEPMQIQFDAEHIFIDPNSGRVRLAIIPVIQPVIRRSESSLQAMSTLKPNTPLSLFAIEFLRLLTSMQKAYSLDENLVESLSLLAEDNELERIHLELLQSSPSFPDSNHQEIEPSKGSHTKTRSSKKHPDDRSCKSNPEPGPGNWLFRILMTGHLLIVFALITWIGVQVLMEFEMVDPLVIDQLPLNLVYRVIGIAATLLLLLDLVTSGLLSNLKQVIFANWNKSRPIDVVLAALKPSTRKTEKSNRLQADPNDQTVILQPAHEAYRLGLLSVGLPGTPEESEGLRAYILVDEFLIGRDETICDLPLPVASIGRKHARIRRREGSFFVSDLGSKNGTSLDGRRLNKMEEYLLPDRCRLEFADQAFYFSAD